MTRDKPKPYWLIIAAIVVWATWHSLIWPHLQPLDHQLHNTMPSVNNDR